MGPLEPYKEQSQPQPKAPAPLITDNPNQLRILRERLLKKKQSLEREQAQLSLALKQKEFVDYVLGDFYAFCVYVMGFKDLYEPLHRWLCDEISDPKSNRKLILIPRGHFKTTVASICYPVWLLCKNPTERIILASSIADKAVECLEEIRERISAHDFQTLFGHVFPRPELWIRNTSDMIRIPRRGAVTGPTILCIGTDSAEVGRHCSRFIIDDMIGKEEVSTPQAREKAWSWLGRQLAVLDPGSEMIVIGTPWHADDPYARLKRLDDWKVVIKPYKENGSYIFPTRFNDKEIDGIRGIMDDYTFACFYELEPISDTVNPFVIDRFQFIDYPNQELVKSDVWTYIMVDPATTVEEYSCPSGIVIADAFASDEGPKFVIKEAISQKLHPDQLVETIFKLVDVHHPRAVIIEAEAQQKTFHYWIKQEQMRRRKTFAIEEVKSPRNMAKYSRIVALQPYLHGHVYVVGRNIPGYHDLMNEFSTYPKGKTDDLICALSLAIPIVTFPAKRTKIEPRLIPVRSRLLTEMVERATTRRRGRFPRISLR